MLQIDTAAFREAPGLLAPDSEQGEEPGIAPSARTESLQAARLQDVERDHILTVLESCGWKVKGRGNAAEHLGLKERTLRARMKKLGIKRPKR
jgi:transcriptional regulator with GAF, ATPase, and Fis domain